MKKTTKAKAQRDTPAPPPRKPPVRHLKVLRDLFME